MRIVLLLLAGVLIGGVARECESSASAQEQLRVETREEKMHHELIKMRKLLAKIERNTR